MAALAIVEDLEVEIRFETHPAEQTQADWAEMGVWPLGRDRAELLAMVTIRQGECVLRV